MTCAIQGRIRPSRRVFPPCLAREDSACDVEEVLWSDPARRPDASSELLSPLVFSFKKCHTESCQGGVRHLGHEVVFLWFWEQGFILQGDI